MDKLDTLNMGLSAVTHEAHGRAVNATSYPRGSDVPDDRRRRTDYWVICTPQARLPYPTEVLCVTGGRGDGPDAGDDSRQALAAFGFREEAEAFRRLCARGRALRVRDLGGRDFISLLYSPQGGLSRVALDPVPEAGRQIADSLVIVGREEFVKLLVSRVSLPAPLSPMHTLASRN